MCIRDSSMSFIILIISHGKQVRMRSQRWQLIRTCFHHAGATGHSCGGSDTTIITNTIAIINWPFPTPNDPTPIGPHARSCIVCMRTRPHHRRKPECAPSNRHSFVEIQQSRGLPFSLPPKFQARQPPLSFPFALWMLGCGGSHR